MRFRPVCALYLLLGLATGISTADENRDPLDSVMWLEMHKRLLNSEPVVFDDRVRVSAPAVAEDSLNLPVWVDASALGKVQRLMIFAELNPIPKVLEMEPVQASPRVGVRIKLQQATPVRAAAQTEDGVWHVGGILVDAAGGGCTAASLGSGSSDWADRLGEVSARLWWREGYSRLRAHIIHPMDTGLVAGIPAFYLEQLELHDADGALISRISLFEPVGENPLLTLDLPKLNQLTLEGRDNNGNPVAALITHDSAGEGEVK
ncbi:MAG: quinoprotein dehydrogenase-associated SoxYZ-like carrier [Candidatus Thiodiazotropha sp. 6PLUC2]